MHNKKKNDDILYIKALKLPGGLKTNETEVDKFVNVFKQKLKIIWHPVDEAGIMRIQDGFIDNTVIREEVIHKIVEVKIHQDKPKKIKRPEPEVRDDVSDETEISVAEDEMALIKADIREMK